MRRKRREQGVWRKADHAPTVACARRAVCCGLAALAECREGDQKEESKAPRQTQTG